MFLTDQLKHKITLCFLSFSDQFLLQIIQNIIITIWRHIFTNSSISFTVSSLLRSVFEISSHSSSITARFSELPTKCRNYVKADWFSKATGRGRSTWIIKIFSINTFIRSTFTILAPTAAIFALYFTKSL